MNKLKLNIMIEPAANSPQFALFTRLPPELRTQIWRLALPYELKPAPALFFYKRGCWEPSRSIEGEPYRGQNDELENLYFKFHCESLGHVEYAMPLGDVNREARGVVGDWLGAQGRMGIRIERRGAVQGVGNGECQDQDRERDQEEEEEEDMCSKFTFTRPYNPAQDALFVTQDTWNDFLIEPSDRQFEPDLLFVTVTLWADPKILAIPKTLIQDEDALRSFSDIFMSFDGLEKLLVIVNDLHLHVDDGKKRWEFGFESAKRGGLVWNLDKRSLEYADGVATGEEVLGVEEANGSMGEGLTDERKKGFEIWPAVAVGR